MKFRIFRKSIKWLRNEFKKKSSRILYTRIILIQYATTTAVLYIYTCWITDFLSIKKLSDVGREAEHKEKKRLTVVNAKRMKENNAYNFIVYLWQMIVMSFAWWTNVAIGLVGWLERPPCHVMQKKAVFKDGTSTTVDKYMYAGINRGGITGEGCPEGSALWNARGEANGSSLRRGERSDDDEKDKAEEEEKDGRKKNFGRKLLLGGQFALIWLGIAKSFFMYTYICRGIHAPLL